MSLKRVRRKTTREPAGPLESHQALFGPPSVLPAESSSDYDALLTRLLSSLAPLDVVEEIFVDDVMRSQWEVLRWQRLKISLMKKAISEILQELLSENLSFDVYRETFEEELARALGDGFPDDPKGKDAKDLARLVMADDSEAVARSKTILNAQGVELDSLEDDIKTDVVADLMTGYARQDADATDTIVAVLADEGKTLDDLAVQALSAVAGADRPPYLLLIERLDQLLAGAENRRNISLHELERYRTGLGQTVRRHIASIEDEDRKTIALPVVRRQTAA